MMMAEMIKLMKRKNMVLTVFIGVHFCMKKCKATEEI